MTDRFYVEQKLVTNADDFRVTIEGFVQCVNLMMADMLIPGDERDSKEAC